MKFNYIAVEGPIGVGKTSLINLLCEQFNARKVLEDTNNPFLEAFYNDSDGSAFQTQLFFLLNRYNQQKNLKQKELFSELTICDYLFAKDKIFAYLTLNESELLIYERLYNALAENLPHPDLVIFLQADDSVLIKRIKSRGREIENNISEKYIKELNNAYNFFFYHYTKSSLLILNTSDIDFVNKAEDLDDLVKTIREMDQGTKYYVPPGSR